jgi:hypothetical protein
VQKEGEIKKVRDRSRKFKSGTVDGDSIFQRFERFKRTVYGPGILSAHLTTLFQLISEDAPLICLAFTLPPGVVFSL